VYTQISWELLIGKKWGRNWTSNIMISIDTKKPEKSGPGYVGKVWDFEGRWTYYNFFDDGKDPNKCKDI